MLLLLICFDGSDTLFVLLEFDIINHAGRPSLGSERFAIYVLNNPSGKLIVSRD